MSTLRDKHGLPASLRPLALGLILATATATAGCDDGASNDGGNNGTVDAAPPADSGVDSAKGDTRPAADLYPDLGELADVGVKQPCESEWIDAVGAQDKVSTGIVSSEPAEGATRTLVDASAGGMQQAQSNPYVYVSLTEGKRVDISDLEARTSTAWDLALRRTVIRLNGGDSGPGKGAVAIIPNKTLEQVTAAPGAGFFTDDFIDEATCKVERDPINNIITAFGGSSGLWYDYEVGTGKVTPMAQVYVLRRADGSLVKLVIDSYYSSGGVSSHYTLRWSPL